MSNNENQEARLSELMDAFGAARRNLQQQAGALAAQMDAVREDARPGLYAALDAEAAARVALHNFIADHPDLFGKKKTRSAEWGSAGWRKKPGRLVCGDTAYAAAVLEECGAADAVTQKITYSLVRARVNALPVAVVKKAGITVEDDVDTVYIKTGHEMDKYIEQLRADSEKERA